MKDGFKAKVFTDELAKVELESRKRRVKVGDLIKARTVIFNVSKNEPLRTVKVVVEKIYPRFVLARHDLGEGVVLRECIFHDEYTIITKR